MRRYRRGGVRMYVAGRELQPAASELERKLWRRWPIAMRPRCDLDEVDHAESDDVEQHDGCLKWWWKAGESKGQGRRGATAKTPRIRPDQKHIQIWMRWRHTSQLRSLHSSLPWYFACIGCAGCHMQEFIICCHSSGTSKDRQC